MAHSEISIIPVQFEDQLWPTVRQIRYEVFVIEQAVDEAEEYDEFESSSRHFLAFVNGKPAGTARWRKTSNGFKLERFAVLADFRKLGVGKALVERVLEDVFPVYSSSSFIYLHAQVQAIPFYEKLGFETYGEEFTEAEIRHKSMRYRLDF